MRKVVAIIQARMGSTRLPGKILKEVLDKPLFAYQLERVLRSSLLDEVVVATTKNPIDQQVVTFCQKRGVPVFCGSEENVLQRYYCAAKAFSADVVVRITADCPLIDPSVIDQVVSFYLEHQDSYDYVSNTLELTYPRGMDVEVFSSEVLEKVADKAESKWDREHVTAFIRQHPSEFRLGNVAWKENASHHRWTVDTPEDFQLIKVLLEAIYPHHPKFTLEDLLQLLTVHPEWSQINAHIQQKSLES